MTTAVSVLLPFVVCCDYFNQSCIDHVLLWIRAESVVVQFKITCSVLDPDQEVSLVMHSILVADLLIFTILCFATLLGRLSIPSEEPLKLTCTRCDLRFSSQAVLRS